jgi:flavin reductase (DIM6/NTAB) family NADH-FMN oxidoreductase RutF
VSETRHPHETDRRAFRDCVGTFATGVTVVAVHHEDACAGMTLNSFTSVSLDPLLVCVSLAHGTRTHELVVRARRFAVSILHAGQQDVARAFATPGLPFPRAMTRVEPDRHVVVDGALAALRCDVSQAVTAGDHDLVLGRVTRFEAGVGEPLVFHRGAFGALDPGPSST